MVVACGGGRTSGPGELEGDVGCVVEPFSADVHGDEHNARGAQVSDTSKVAAQGDLRQKHEIESVCEGVGEDPGQEPAVWRARGQNAVDGQGHHNTIVEQGGDQDHERREVEPEREGQVVGVHIPSPRSMTRSLNTRMTIDHSARVSADIA